MHGSPDPKTIDPGDAKTWLSQASEAEQHKLIRSWLDGSYQSARAFWQYVVGAGGLAVPGDERHPEWKFVANAEDVTKILMNDADYVVSEYDRRMRATSGRFYLGMDGDEHTKDAQLGEIIPSWNTPDNEREPDLAVLDNVKKVAEKACKQVLALNGELGVLAAQADPSARCRVPLAVILGPVLDACAHKFFGLKGPSSLSLLSWAKDITSYHFRPYADDSDRGRARDASGQFRSHVLASLAAVDDDSASCPLRAIRDQLSEVLQENKRKTADSGSDDDIARNLLGILTGSLTATYKAVSDALTIRADQHIQPDIWGDSSQDAPDAAYPHYDRIIAKTLGSQHRGSLDAVYRTYKGEASVTVGAITINKGDLVIVWLGGTMHGDDKENNLYGIGVHKCPGIDFGKATIEGALMALTRLTGDAAPKIEVESDMLYLVFPKPQALMR